MLALVTCVLTGAGASALAQPTLRVRAETRIELSGEPVAGGVQVDLTLRDDLGAAIAGAEISLTLRDANGEERTQRIRTGANGQFAGRVRSPTPTTEILARYQGGGTYAATRAERTLDAGQRATTLTLSAVGGEELDLDQAKQVFHVHAASAAGAQDLRIELLDELSRVVAAGRTDASGDWRLEVPSADIGPIGAGRLAARATGDARRADAQVELPIVRYRATRLTLEVADDPLRPDTGVALQGSLADSRAGLGHRAVGLYVDQEHWFTILTDATGAFAAQRKLPATEASSVEIAARYASEGPGRPDAASETLERHVQAPFSWTWLALVLPLLLMAAGVYWGTRPRRAPQAVDRARTTRPPVSHVEAGAPQSRRKRFTTVGGNVEDGRDRLPLSDVVVRALDRGEVVAESRTDEVGVFALGTLPQGELELEVDAEAYEISRATLQIPHRGEWSRLTVRLRSLRWQASEAFEPVAAELLGANERAAARTSTEAAAEAPGKLQPDVSALARAVDRAAYAADDPRRDVVAEIERNAHQVARELRSERSRRG